MTSRAEILAEQERTMRWVVVSTAAGVIPFLLIAMVSQSMMLWSDALDYVRAFVVELIAWRIVRGVSRNEFADYDYGADKVQSLAGGAGSLLYVCVLIALGAASVHRLIHPVDLHDGFSLAGAGLQLISAAVDAYFWIRNRRLSAQVFSPVLEMQWRANRVSALLSTSMAVGLILSVALQSQSWSFYIDPALALIFIAYGAISFLPDIARDFESLSDKTLKEDLQLRIDRRLSENFGGYSGFHGVRSRRSGGRIFIEIALSFPGQAKVEDVMSTVTALRDGIQQDIPGSEVSVVLHGSTPEIAS